ncbi:MAG: zf-HC2 domain-containing protein [Leptolyngbyaceae cyanobacterium bins.59]|nr:zf-HC2 domain-containing protein [Leptolyngbyaceae cyanobacterium bins.59]
MIHQSNLTPDPLKRDAFELLSAYLDSELTAVERRQVEAWLETDPTAQQLYKRLLKLRHGIQNLPIPESSPAQQVAGSVFRKLGQRFRQKLVWGGVGIAALLVAAVGGLPNSSSLAPKLATVETQQPARSLNKSDGLMIALDRPVVEIPKAPVSMPEATLRNLQDGSNPSVTNN